MDKLAQAAAAYMAAQTNEKGFIMQLCIALAHHCDRDDLAWLADAICERDADDLAEAASILRGRSQNPWAR
jgi:hypothetical protein